MLRTNSPYRIAVRTVAALALLASTPLAAQDIEAFAGGGVGDGGTDARFVEPHGVRHDTFSNQLVVVDRGGHRVRVRGYGVSEWRTIAGTGVPGFSGDGGPADAARLDAPTDVVEYYGSTYIVDAGNRRIRRIFEGTIATVAGNGSDGSGGDGGPATAAPLGRVGGIAVDDAGNLYIALPDQHRVRRVSPGGQITTFAGTGTAGSGGDGGPANAAQLASPEDIAFHDGKLYIADTGNGLVRVVDDAGVVSTYAGARSGGLTGDGVPATSALLDEPVSIAVRDDDGLVAFLEAGSARVRAVVGGNIATLAGDGGTVGADEWYELPRSAVATSLGDPTQIGFGPPTGSTPGLFVADRGGIVLGFDDGQLVQRIGDGVGDGAPLAQAVFEAPTALAGEQPGWYPDAMLAFASQRLRQLAGGAAISLAGDGRQRAAPSDGPASTTPFGTVTGVVYATMHDGFLLTEASSHRIRRVSGASDPYRETTTWAGNGAAGNSGDGAHCMLASFDAPAGIARVGTDIYVSTGHRIRSIDSNCIVGFAAGANTPGFAGDGESVYEALFDRPGALYSNGYDTLYVADRGNRRIRAIETDGAIRTVAGNGSDTVSGIGGPATEAGIGEVGGLVVDWQGRLVFTVPAENRVLYIDRDGKLQPYAGTGVAGHSGDGGPAVLAQLDSPTGLALMPDQSILVADTGNDRIRRLRPLAPHGTTVPGAPPAPTATAGWGEAKVVLTPPDDDGGSPITGYEVRSNPAGAIDSAYSSSTSLERVLWNLTDGVTYTFQVRALNQGGAGAWSAPSNPVTSSSDAVPQLSFPDVEFPEGDDPTNDTTAFTVTLDRPAPETLTLQPRIVLGLPDTTGVADSYDQPWVDWDLVIPAGATTATLYVTARGDTDFESDETFSVTLHDTNDVNVVRAATVTIRNDDLPGVLALRDDVFTVRENRPTELAIFRNDRISHAVAGDPARIVVAPTLGTVSLQTQGTPSTHDDRLLYTPAADTHGEDRFRYETCYDQGYCRRATVTVLLRPSTVARRSLSSDLYHKPWIDVPMDDLRELPAPRYVATAVVPPSYGKTRTITQPPAGSIDSLDPWFHSPPESRGVDVYTIPPPADGQPRRVRIAARVDGPVAHLYLGIDDDGNAWPSPAETRCVLAESDEPFCEAEVEQGAGQTIRYWTMLHGSDFGGPYATRAITWAVPLVPGDARTAATGPGSVPAGEPFTVRVAHRRDATVDAPVVGFVMTQSAPGVDAGLFAVEFARYDYFAAERLVGGRETRQRVVGASHDALFIDVPPGATKLTLTSRASTGNVDFFLVRQGEWNNTSARIDDVGTEGALAQVATASGDETLAITTPTLTEGRWYVVPRSAPETTVDFTLKVTLEGADEPVPSGSFYNPGRPGHGLFLYPAGGDWAGLWYTYRYDGTPTWYWLQGAKPGAGGVWTGTIYRAAWNGSANHLVEVGEATVTPGTADVPAFRYSYVLDGETGSEPMFQLGEGCPLLDGAPVRINTHWFNPDRAGTGYSVQLWEDYEFLAAFVYDAHGVPRYVAGERNGFGGANASMPLYQTNGACPMCDWRPAEYVDVGVLTRVLQPDGRLRIVLDGVYVDGVPGAWSVDEIAQTLGGPGTTQACPAD